MAALDFPPGTTVGQTFAAGNGVVYTWNGTLWLASGSSSGGDFVGRSSGGFGDTNPVVPTLTVINGNSGGWYSANRFTPPAGRYLIYGYWSHVSSGGSTQIQLLPRKNGTAIPNAGGISATPLANVPAEVSFTMNVDANGTDWFDMTCQSINSPGTSLSIVMGAFPISGIKGPPGDVGSLGQTIKCVFGSGALTVGAWGAVGFSVVSNDTGVTPSSTSWTPPAGRWAIQAGFNFEGSAGATYILAFSPGSQRGYAYTPSNGFITSTSIFDVVDFNGSTPLGFQVHASLAGNAYTGIPHYWIAYKVK